MYRQVLRGVDLIYYGSEGQLEFDLTIAPGLDPTSLALEIEGAEGLALGDHGEAVIKTSDGTLHLAPPATYQEADGKKFEIAARYKLLDSNRIGFEIAS